MLGQRPGRLADRTEYDADIVVAVRQGTAVVEDGGGVACQGLADLEGSAVGRQRLVGLTGRRGDVANPLEGGAEGAAGREGRARARGRGLGQGTGLLVGGQGAGAVV